MELLVRDGARRAILIAAWGKFTLTLEDVVRLKMPPMFGDANAMVIVLEGYDQMKLNYLTTGMAASKAFGKLTYVTQLRCFS